MAYLTRADENKAIADEMMIDAESDSAGVIEIEYIGLNTRRVISKDQNELQRIMNYFTGSFEFECEQIFLDNAFGYLVTLPRIILD